MRSARRLLASWLLLAGLAAGACIPIAQASQKIGADACVTGTVVRVAESTKGGAWFLDFCEDYHQCPFAVVVFTRDLKDVGDVRQLKGKTIEIFGRIKLFNGRAEIILKNARQLRGEAAKLSPLPKDYDVERHGRYRVSAPSAPSSKRPTGGASKAVQPGAPAQPQTGDVEKPDSPR